MANIEEKVEELVRKPIEELGYSIYDVQYAKEGKDHYLRIFIDKETGISLEDCEKVNNAITDQLDEANYIKEAYFLEISSPGIERPIRKERHLKENIGKEVYITLFRLIEKKKEMIGILKEYTQENIMIEIEEQEIQIDKKNIANMKTVYHWDEERNEE